jgi:serine/threonine protein kinase
MIAHRQVASSTCPKYGILEKVFLDVGDYPKDALAQLDEHLATCVSCRRAVDRLMNDEQTESWRRIGQKHGDQTLHFPATADQSTLPKGIGPIEHYLRVSDSDYVLGELGNYRILGQLGNGSMGFVYLAEDRQLLALRALKLPCIDFIDNSIANERFLREARLAAQVRDPNVVAILNVTKVPPCPLPILVMEYVDGVSLALWMNESARRSITEIVLLMIDVAKGLVAIHDAKIVHRDLKPSNILIDRVSGKAKIADFGLARDSLQVNDATRNSVVGTPGYMSPEQITSPELVDHRSDLFCFGTILYELLSGERPFRGAHDLMVQHQIVAVDPVQPSTFNDGVPRDLETIAMKCLAKAAHHRYHSARDLLDDLENFQNHRPIHARPASIFQKLRLKCKRHPQQAVLAALLVGTILASFFLVTSFWRSAVHGREQLSESIKQMEIQKEKSEHNYRIACDILDKLVLQQVSTEGLDVALMNPEQLETIRRGQEMLVTRIEEGAKSDKAAITSFQAQLNHVRTYRQLAYTNFSLRDLAGAQKGYSQALDILERLSSEGDTRNEKAQILEGQAVLAHTHGNISTAKHLVLAAIDQRKQIVADFPENGRFQDDLVAVELRAADIFLHDHDRDSALKYFELVCEQIVAQLAVGPTPIRFETLAGVSLILAGQYRLNGDSDKALSVIDRVLDFYFKCDKELTTSNLRFNCNLMCLLKSKISIEKEDWIGASRVLRQYVSMTSIETQAHPDHYDIVNQFVDIDTLQNKIESGLRASIEKSVDQSEQKAIAEELQLLLAIKQERN